jgi:hypothetical protein
VQLAFYIMELPIQNTRLWKGLNERYRQIAVGAVHRAPSNLSFAVDQFLRVTW